MISPKFKNYSEYEKAQMLMQPIFIRVLDNIRKESESLNWQVSYEEINNQEIDESLPPQYIVSLQKNNYQIKKDVWQLCFEICLLNYSQEQNSPVETDKSLLEEDGQVNWQTLESKTKKLVKILFVQT